MLCSVVYLAYFMKTRIEATLVAIFFFSPFTFSRRILVLSDESSDVDKEPMDRSLSRDTQEQEFAMCMNRSQFLRLRLK